MIPLLRVTRSGIPRTCCRAFCIHQNDLTADLNERMLKMKEVKQEDIRNFR